jgi:monofunctional biosynthetic peptidoglycan transglycosylase
MMSHPAFQKIVRYLTAIICIQIIYVFSLRYIYPPITITQLVSWVSGQGLSRTYIPMENISEHAKLAVLAAEDQRFIEHYGFDMESIKNAIEKNKKSKRIKYGGSTISQQVAKNVFLWQGRDWIRKGLEVYFTFLIETLWSKERILEMYLNVIEMGRGVYGIEAASQKYYHTSAKKLTRRQAAEIAVTLPNPKHYRTTPLKPDVHRRVDFILNQMKNLEGSRLAKISK